MRSTGAFQFEVRRAGIHLAERAYSAVARRHLLAQIAGVGAKTPFMDAPIRTERETARGNFEVAPAAERAAVGAFAKAVRSAWPPGMVRDVLMTRSYLEELGEDAGLFAEQAVVDGFVFRPRGKDGAGGGRKRAQTFDRAGAFERP